MGNVKLGLAAFMLSSVCNAAFIPPELFDTGIAESGSESWIPTDLTGTTESTVLINFGDEDSRNTFGMYLTNGVSVLSSLMIIDDDITGDGILTWDHNAKTVIGQYGVLDYSDAYTIGGYELGFYYDVGGERYNSHSFMNSGQFDQVGMYNEANFFGPAPDSMVVYMVDKYNPIRDYMYVEISGAGLGQFGNPATTVPEPGPILLMGTALVGMAVRRKFKQASM